ncbi:MAG TPA: hypothetical protein VFZ48_04835 [Candidatus Saccharimonadales bacterium]
MATEIQKGFTILETMLFLGISGLLMVTLLAGTTVAIQRQRYSDSINSTQSFFQDQFGDAFNVVNARDGRQMCDANNFIVPAEDSTKENRGASDCLVLGRAIEVPVGGTTFQSYAVVGRPPSIADPSSLRDDELLQQYNPTMVRDIDELTFDIPWGARVVAARKDRAEAVNRILILRSPKSGAIYTYAYTSPGSESRVQAGILQANRRLTVNLCVKSADIVSSTSIISLAMGGGPEAVRTEFDIPAGDGRC